MAEIYVMIRNQDRRVMPSVNGERVLVLLIQNEQPYRQTLVNLEFAFAIFQNLPDGNYSIIVRHPDLNPTEALYGQRLSENTILGLRFVYTEPLCTESA